MAKKLQPPYALPLRGLPNEFKYDYAMGGYAGLSKAFLYAIREKYGATAALEIYDLVCTMDDRVKNLTNSIRTIFNLQDNNCRTIGEFFDIYDEFTGIESTILKRLKSINIRKVTKCPWKTEAKDISDWAISFYNVVSKTINPNITFKRPKAMCAGDAYCEYIWKLEESSQLTEDDEVMAAKLETPCEAPKKGLSWAQKYDFAMRHYTDFIKGFLYAAREKYGAAEALNIYTRVCKMDNRVKNLVNAIRKIFKIEGNDAEAIGLWWDIWHELCGQEATILERSKTINRDRITKCPWKTKHKDISDWAFIFTEIGNKAFNEKTTFERPKAMCAGDPYCEYIYTIED